MKFSSLLIVIFIFVSKTLFSQYLVTDTVFIQFKYNSIIPTKFYIDTILDNRHSHDKLISYTSKKKLLLIPVDQEIHLKTPLTESLTNSFKTKLETKDTLSFEIDRFIITKYRGRFSGEYILEADFRVIKNNEFKGFISYNYGYSPRNKKTTKPIICEEILTDWNTQFRLDLLTTSAYLNNLNTDKPDNFLTENLKRPSFFSTTIGTVVGLNFWQIEGEMYFTRPETSENRLFKAGIIRYQNTEELEMIGFGKKSEHLHKRLAPKLIFDLSTNFLIGINKWKNTENVKLQQVVQLSFSSTQSLNFNKENAPGWLFKAGLFENAYYIIEKPIKFQIGVYLSTGYKF